MSDYLGNLAARGMASPALIQPRLAARFEPWPPAGTPVGGASAAALLWGEGPSPATPGEETMPLDWEMTTEVAPPVAARRALPPPGAPTAAPVALPAVPRLAPPAPATDLRLGAPIMPPAFSPAAPVPAPPPPGRPAAPAPRATDEWRGLLGAAAAPLAPPPRRDPALAEDEPARAPARRPRPAAETGPPLDAVAEGPRSAPRRAALLPADTESAPRAPRLLVESPAIAAEEPARPDPRPVTALPGSAVEPPREKRRTLAEHPEALAPRPAIRPAAVVAQPIVTPAPGPAARPEPPPAATPEPPTIHVTIGRIEVRATPAPAARARPAPPAAPTVSLEDYLRRPAGGGPR